MNERRRLTVSYQIRLPEKNVECADHAKKDSNGKNLLESTVLIRDQNSLNKKVRDGIISNKPLSSSEYVY